jgi:hypothetical protein
MSGERPLTSCRLQGLQLHLAPLDGAARGVLGPVAELKRERPLREPAVLHLDCLDAVQDHDEGRALGGDLIGDWPPALGMGETFATFTIPPGAVARVGPLVVDVGLVGIVRGDLLGIRDPDEDPAVGGGIRPPLPLSATMTPSSDRQSSPLLIAGRDCRRSPRRWRRHGHVLLPSLGLPARPGRDARAGGRCWRMVHA